MALDDMQLLQVQILVNLVAWSSLAIAFARPRLAELDGRRALRWLIAPQMFRVIGMTLLASNVAGPGLPAAFRERVATGDFITSLLAIITFAALSLRGRVGVVLAALTTLVGLADIGINLVNGMRVHAAEHLQSAWFVVSIVVPLMIVAHVAAIGRLVQRATWVRA